MSARINKKLDLVCLGLEFRAKRLDRVPGRIVSISVRGLLALELTRVRAFNRRIKDEKIQRRERDHRLRES
jgi:hypothetical protein